MTRGRPAAVALGLALAVAGAAPAPGAPPYAPSVQVMVAGRARVLEAPRTVTARPATAVAGGRRCAVAGGTPLAALEAARRLRGPSYALRDFGSCSADPRDSASLFVFRVGPDVNHGRDGWVYKVDRRAGTTGAADPSGPFGGGRRLRPGQRVTWFYCRMGLRGCQPTLVAVAPARAAPGAALTVSVRGYDDFARSRPAQGALVRLAGASAMTGPQGTATVAAPQAPGRYAIRAAASGAVPAFPVTVTIG